MALLSRNPCSGSKNLLDLDFLTHIQETHTSVLSSSSSLAAEVLKEAFLLQVTFLFLEDTFPKQEK